MQNIRLQKFSSYLFIYEHEKKKSPLHNFIHKQYYARISFAAADAFLNN